MIRPVFWLTWVMLRVFFGVFWRYRVTGAENLPATGPYILAANHRSNADPLLLGCTPRRYNFFFAKRELFESRLLGFYIRALGAFPVDRGEADLGAVRHSLGVLKKGHVLVFFPEGTRSVSGDFLPAQAGLGMIALRAGVPVVPVYVHGTAQAAGHLISRTPVQTRIGKPIDPAGVTRMRGRKAYQEIADFVLDQIKELARETITDEKKESRVQAP